MRKYKILGLLLIMKLIQRRGIGFVYWEERSGLTSELADRSSPPSIDLLSQIQSCMKRRNPTYFLGRKGV
jgi:hypothetical protein